MVEETITLDDIKKAAELIDLSSGFPCECEKVKETGGTCYKCGIIYLSTKDHCAVKKFLEEMRK